MAVMYCSGEFLFDGCNRVSSLTPIHVPRHPCRPPGASGSLFSSESLIHASPPRRSRYRRTLRTRRPCKDTLTRALRVYIPLPYAPRRKFIVLRTRFLLHAYFRACLFLSRLRLRLSAFVLYVHFRQIGADRKMVSNFERASSANAIVSQTRSTLSSRRNECWPAQTSTQTRDIFEKHCARREIFQDKCAIVKYDLRVERKQSRIIKRLRTITDCPRSYAINW